MRRLVLSSVAVAIAAIVALLWWPAYEIDAEMERLCKVEGGVHVFETVPIEPDQVRPDGLPIFLRETIGGVKYADWLGSTYRMELAGNVIMKRGHIELNKTVVQVVRRVDSKVLANSVSFSRYGGYIPLAEGAANFCPKGHGSTTDMIKATFVSTNFGVKK